MKRILSLTVAAGIFCGCQSEIDEYRDGIPSKSMVEVALPGRNIAALEEAGHVRQELQGERAGFYELTRGATVIINGGVVRVLVLLKAITNHPPTSHEGNVAVWGPHTDALSPNTWKLTVVRTANKNFSYILEGKAKTAPDTAYVAVLSGNHSVGNGQEAGQGEFLLDWDRAQTLPEHDGNVGTAVVTYSRTDAGAVSVDVVFTQVTDGGADQLVDAHYAYAASAGNGGSFDYSARKDLDSDLARAAAENLTIRSRWLQTGAGRSDVRATGGDLGSAAATASECWDTNFNSQFLTVSWVAAPIWGTEAAACVFPTADYANP